MSIDFPNVLASSKWYDVGRNPRREILTLSRASCDKKLPNGIMWCFHGTNLNIGHKILYHEGLKAGVSTDNGKTGVFFIGPGSVDEKCDVGVNFQLARDRAKCILCTEWNAFGAPSAWSMPVVLMFQHPTSDVTGCGYLNGLTNRKWVIQRPPGTILPQLLSTRLLLDLEEFRAWTLLHNNPPSPSISVMCGGRIFAPYHWASVCMPASCGRICKVSELNKRGWKCAINVSTDQRIYRCPECTSRLRGIT